MDALSVARRREGGVELMKVHVGQIYVEPGVRFPFSTRMQLWLGEQLSALATPTSAFLERHGPDTTLMIRISARRALSSNEVRGPSVFRRDKSVEYVIFLPYDVIMASPSSRAEAAASILAGVEEVFRRAGLELGRLASSKPALIEQLGSEPSLVLEPWFGA